MKIFRRIFLAWSIYAAMSGQLRCGAAVPAPGKPTVESLAWLAGAWSLERNGQVVTENWGSPLGGMMQGVSRTAVNGKTVASEFLVIRANADGGVFYVAKPSGQAETAFRLVRTTEREAVFENMEHDFPRRIRYTLKDDGTLLAAIEGTQNGKNKRVEFPYRPEKKSP